MKTDTIKNILKIVADVLLVLLLMILIGRAVVVGSTAKYEKSLKKAVWEAESDPLHHDAIIVLGCSVDSAKNPSSLLQYRLDRALELYEAKASDRILVTGDQRSDDYDEVSVMKNYLLARGVPESKILTDPKGNSTYESIYRAASEYQLHNPIIITQQYHLYRALYIADAWSMNATGVAAQDSSALGNIFRIIREWFAGIKDMNYCWQKVTP